MPSKANPALIPALVTLRDQFNRRYPNRSKASDGWIGDQAHASRTSYHNPDANGWVHAMDITHDPGQGVDIDRITDELVASGDSRILELIANGMYWHYSDRRWVKYTGSNQHNKHFHITVKPGPTAMNATGWGLPSFGGTPAPAPAAPAPSSNVLKVGSSGAEVTRLQQTLNRVYPAYSKLVIDGEFGAATESVVKEFQRRSHLTVDGIVGDATKAKLYG